MEFKFGINAEDNESGFGLNHIENIDLSNPTVASQFGSINPKRYSGWNFDKGRPGSLNVEEVNKMLDEVALKKTSLAELILNSHFEKNWLEFNDLGSYQHPLISGDLELIVTGFDDKDYYGDGYSFYREKVENLIQTPVFRNFDMQKSDFIISN